MTQYDFRPAAFIPAGVNAQTIGGELERIRLDNNGCLIPADVVKCARAKRSPLHSCFEWDDAKAAQLQREERARYLIACVEIQTAELPTRRVRAFVNVHNVKGETFYHNTLDALADEYYSDQVITQAAMGLQQWKKRYENFSLLRKAFRRTLKAIDVETKNPVIV